MSINCIHDFSPDLSRSTVEQTLGRLTVKGELRAPRLLKKAARLSELFRVFARTAPVPLWAPGLIFTREIRCVTECYLPLAEIEPALINLCQEALRYSAFFPATPFGHAASWPDLLERLFPFVCPANPGQLISQAVEDEGFRRAFLFSLFLPRRFSGGFQRYPAQLAFIENWLLTRLRTGGVGIRCLDAACGCGEGTYDLMELLIRGGMTGRDTLVEGVTIEPLELVAAAHGYFPHDPLRERSFQKVVAPLVRDAGGIVIRFRPEDVRSTGALLETYDLIVCNGILGGPLLPERKDMVAVCRSLAARLKAGGLLVAADRFHDGWTRAVPVAERARILQDLGLRVIEVGEGVAGIRS